MRDECNHFWVERTDGYEELCGPAICLICGLYSCTCKFISELQDMPNKRKERRMGLFKSLGIPGDNHKLENDLANNHFEHAKKVIADWPKWKQQISS